MGAVLWNAASGEDRSSGSGTNRDPTLGLGGDASFVLVGCASVVTSTSRVLLVFVRRLLSDAVQFADRRKHLCHGRSRLWGSLGRSCFSVEKPKCRRLDDCRRRFECGQLRTGYTGLTSTGCDLDFAFDLRRCHRLFGDEVDSGSTNSFADPAERRCDEGYLAKARQS